MSMDYTIKINFTDTAARQAIDSAAHQAVTRFRDDLGDLEELAHSIAVAAATTALEHFKAYCNAELRLIQIEHERRAQDWMMRPPSLLVQKS